MFSSYNRKVATTTIPCPIQLPCFMIRMMEPLSHYHYDIYCCKPIQINLHQKICTDNLNHVSTMHQPVPQPVINLYHKKVHQPCTNLYHEQVHQPCIKPVQITFHNNLFKKPITKTCLINIINQIRSTHEDQSPKQLSNMFINES
jgi:hypothetical protein